MELLFVERSVVVRNRGSVEFTTGELAADIVLVDIKCEAIGGTVYYNTKTLPPYGFYGSVTLFGGATVKERMPLEFVYQRVLDWESIYRRLRCYLTRISIRQEASDSPNPGNYFTPTGDALLPDSFEYRGLPYSKLKINSERYAQYTVTVRSYSEATGFACQSQNKPDDPTKGEDEYPEPLPVPNSGDFPAGLAQPDLPYPGANPEDFEGSGAGQNQSFGTATYEYRDNASSWRTNTVANLGYPGRLVAGSAGNGNNEVRWRDNAGLETTLVEGAAPPVRVRGFRIAQPNGGTYTPFVDFFSN